jgi:hypothetical protein
MLLRISLMKELKERFWKSPPAGGGVLSLVRLIKPTTPPPPSPPLSPHSRTLGYEHRTLLRVRDVAAQVGI